MIFHVKYIENSQLQLMQISLNFKTSCCNFKIRGLGTKVFVWLFYYFNFERNYDVLKSKNPYFLLNKNINFNKNQTGLKRENPTHSFRGTNLVNRELKVKLTSLSSRKEKEGIFCTVSFVQTKFF